MKKLYSGLLLLVSVSLGLGKQLDEKESLKELKHPKQAILWKVEGGSLEKTFYPFRDDPSQRSEGYDFTS